MNNNVEGMFLHVQSLYPVSRLQYLKQWIHHVSQGSNTRKGFQLHKHSFPIKNDERNLHSQKYMSNPFFKTFQCKCKHSVEVSDTFILNFLSSQKNIT